MDCRNNHMAEISPFRLYHASDLRELLGRRCLVTLRRVGQLRAIGDKYLRQQVIDSFLRAAQVKSGVSPVLESEVKSEKGKRQEKEVGKVPRHGKVERVPVEQKPDDLRGQLEGVQRQIRAEAVLSRGSTSRHCA